MLNKYDRFIARCHEFSIGLTNMMLVSACVVVSVFFLVYAVPMLPKNYFLLLLVLGLYWVVALRLTLLKVRFKS